jgi:hypothetical protein
MHTPYALPMKLHSNARTRGTAIDGRLCLRPLAACLAVTLCSGAAATDNHAHGQALVAAMRGNRAARFVHPSAATSAVAHVVSTCDDPLPVPSTCEESIDNDNGVHTVQTLRLGFLCAQNGDRVDLRKLTCSKITLSAPLVAGPGSVTLDGPGQDKLTIDATGKFRALLHNAGEYYGLYINDLTIANGRYDSPLTLGVGGCISSNGNVFVSDSAVSSCYVSSSVSADGGGIFASGMVSLYRSSVTGSTAHGNGGGNASGGGIVTSYLELNKSTVSGNTASYTGTGQAFGGGVSVYAIQANNSTISGNGAATAKAGIYAAYANLFNSTVSGNHADHGPVGGVYARFGAQIFNSTITANTGKGAFAAGLYGGFATSATSTLQSTIIANNRASGIELDVGSTFGFAILGSNNLIMAPQDGTRVPFDTIVEDPLLGTLQDNGGPTRTHALLPGSPAIDRGKIVSGVAFDQRGFPRVVGSKPDIGAFEFDPDRIFGNGFNL